MKRLVTVALVLLLTLTATAAAATPQTTLPDIEDEVMCPICGTLLGLSRAPAAERERVFIRKLISEGKTKAEIEDALVAEYGPQVLAEPDDDGINLFAYVIPVAIFILAVLAVIFTVIRWRRNRKLEPPERDHAPPPPGDDAQLDQDMAEYDL